MQATEARGLLHKLTAAFPGSGVGDDTIVLWLGYVAKVPVEVGAPAVDSLIGTCRKFPTLAEWQEACRMFRGSIIALPSSSECVICQDGFLFAQDDRTVLCEFIDDKATGEKFKVPRRCPNGCLPGKRAKPAR